MGATLLHGGGTPVLSPGLCLLCCFPRFACPVLRPCESPSASLLLADPPVTCGANLLPAQTGPRTPVSLWLAATAGTPFTPSPATNCQPSTGQSHSALGSRGPATCRPAGSGGERHWENQQAVEDLCSSLTPLYIAAKERGTPSTIRHNGGSMDLNPWATPNQSTLIVTSNLNSSGNNPVLGSPAAPPFPHSTGGQPTQKPVVNGGPSPSKTRLCLDAAAWRSQSRERLLLTAGATSVQVPPRPDINSSGTFPPPAQYLATVPSGSSAPGRVTSTLSAPSTSHYTQNGRLSHPALPPTLSPALGRATQLLAAEAQPAPGQRLQGGKRRWKMRQAVEDLCSSLESLHIAPKGRGTLSTRNNGGSVGLNPWVTPNQSTPTVTSNPNSSGDNPVLGSRAAPPTFLTAQRDSPRRNHSF
ncbi:hypothetical protein TREES_T100006795 [Tupaia chinensis]|uniref:Uncharacterized protein n=1 Tax=Tupaia chinensis TaxID=246437 RepID=L9JRI0_TUPCH|nr:hypothetical protein TREES_T100006795 [Tupaia chinensis]